MMISQVGGVVQEDVESDGENQGQQPSGWRPNGCIQFKS